MRTRFTFLLAILLLHFPSCITTYNKIGVANLHPDYKTIIADSVAVTYFTHFAIKISSTATSEAEKILKRCDNICLLTADDTDKLLQDAGVFVFPEHSTPAFMDSLNKIIPYRYLLRGVVNEWREPVFKGRLSGPKVDVSLELWDLQNKKIVWTFSGGEQSEVLGRKSNILYVAHEAKTQMKSLLKRAFKTWGGLCDYLNEEKK